jgi:hypothetical protein
LPRGVVVGQHAPLTTRDHDVQDGIDDLTHLQGTGATAGFCRRHERADTIPLAVSQVSWVSLVVHPQSLPQSAGRSSPLIKQALRDWTLANLTVGVGW